MIVVEQTAATADRECNEVGAQPVVNNSASTWHRGILATATVSRNLLGFALRFKNLGHPRERQSTIRNEPPLRVRSSCLTKAEEGQARRNDITILQPQRSPQKGRARNVRAKNAWNPLNKSISFREVPPARISTLHWASPHLARNPPSEPSLPQLTARTLPNEVSYPAPTSCAQKQRIRRPTQPPRRR